MVEVIILRFISKLIFIRNYIAKSKCDISIVEKTHFSPACPQIWTEL